MKDAEDALEKALYSALEQTIQREYPNPNGEGCPNHSFLERAATAPASLNQQENALIVNHIPKCWPCFKELKQLRETQRARNRPRE